MVISLYKCEVCGVASFNTVDHGRTWYTECCGTCKVFTYSEKVVIEPRYSKDITSLFEGHGFAIEEKSDDVTQKTEIDVNRSEYQQPRHGDMGYID